jgi:hypothetical protein
MGYFTCHHISLVVPYITRGSHSKDFHMIKIGLLIAVSLLAASGGSPQVKKPCVINYRSERLYVGTDQCMKKFPLVKLHGIYSISYEESLFLIGEDKIPGPVDLQERGIWASYDGRPLPGFDKARRGGGRTIYRVDVLARYAHRKGAFGPRGAHDYGMLITRFLSVKRIK